MAQQHVSFVLPNVQRQGVPLTARRTAQPPMDEEEAEHHPHLHHHVVEMPPPAVLPHRRPVTCISLGCLALVGCCAFLGMLLIELPFLEAALPNLRSQRGSIPRRRGTGLKTSEAVEMGLWDEFQTITPMQLNVAVSLALRVDERHVDVVAKENHFFLIQLHEDVDALFEQMQSPEFSYALNERAGVFGGRLIVSSGPSILSNATG